MIRRGKREKPRPEASAPVPPSRPPTVDEAARTVEQPVVPGGDEPEPSAQVLDELLSFFGVRHGESRHRSSTTTTTTADPSAPVPSAPAAPPPVADAPPVAAQPPADVADAAAAGLPDAAADVAAPDVAADAPAIPPAGVPGSPTEFGLVRAPTKHQTRRSAREAKREQKAQEKRLAQLAKKRKKAERKAARKAGKKGAAAEDPAGAVGPDVSEGVRIIAASPAPAAPVTDPSAPVDGPGIPPAPALGTAEPGVGVTSAGPAEDRATVSIGGGDDLPDAVYLESSLDADGSADRSTVFIDDKDPATGAMVSMEVATSASRIEPRLRDRRIAVKRAVGRKRLKWIAIGTFVVGVVVAALAVMGSGLFAVDDIRVEGAVYSVGPELDAIVADLDGQNVLRVDTGRIEEELRRIPWVEEARVTTDFPHGAIIELRERVPVLAYLGPDQKYRVLDSAGRVITVLDGRPTDYLELMVDPGDAPSLAAGALAPEGYRAAATLVTALVDPLRPMVESLSVDAAGTDLTMQLVNGVEVRFGAAEALQDKLVRLTVALIETDPEKAPTSMIDVSTPDIVTR